MRNIYIILILSVLLLACSGKHCIKIGGNYEGIQGDLEYCFDQHASAVIQAPILADQDGNPNIILNHQSVEAINEMLGTPVVGLKAFNNFKHRHEDIEQLLRAIKKHREAQSK
jgi:hypothetical protein